LWLKRHHHSPSNYPSGIGLGIAGFCLFNDADKVCPIDIGKVGEEFQALSTCFPGKVFAVNVDVTKEDSVQQAVDKAIAEAKALYGTACNAGRTKYKPASEVTTEVIEQLWNVNLFGSFYCARVSARAFIKVG